ncbi:HTH-type transcriptional regulator Xre [Pelotomaculum schinkii]|uniref:HTH-type transcriptional regulator Xre n=1 Tax=Pelotomaculum schinkii TaxID=78350 RepID=A0A4Y7RAM8_9FIRM|nr:MULTISPECIES: helix-turn-helix transcriptional regulator [Pelotomaculum]TEB06014.1 HTH-type transcriptional regulator Xre [Pelotomaculum schinkii]TEB13948.1 HTH-type transcriptional regulator Xre [Pelotomaculum sp. FP]
MKEINIAKTLVTKRKEKGITQDELAAYIGVSKASVSKWETAQSYPDITFLPQLAAYFNISIDDLIGYAPQMTKEDIKKLYHRLSSTFATRPFDDVLEECRRIIKKYYSCFPLLFQMAVLLANHHMLAEEKKRQEAILNEAVELCIRIKTESDDVWLSKDATSLEAVCYLMLNQPQQVLDLLGESLRPIPTDHEVVARAYQILGNGSKAKEVTQISMYQHLLALIGATPAYLLLNADNSEKTEEILHRSLSVATIYHLDRLHPNTMAQIYFTAAQVYSLQGNAEKALDMLRKYADICTMGFFPYSLHGDSFFDAIDVWFADFDLGADAPRNEKVIKESMLQAVLSNPAFAALAKEPRYKSIIETLKTNSRRNSRE